jgi:hypothetical protein
LPVAPVERVDIPVTVKTRPTGRGGSGGKRGR